MHVSLQCHTFNEFGQEVSSSLGFLHPVPLHDLSVPVDADVPRPSWLGLSVQDGRVGHVVVLKHTLFELTLRREVFLKYTHTQKRGKQRPRQVRAASEPSAFFGAHVFFFFFFICSIIYIFTPQFCRVQLGMGGNGRNISSWQGVFAVASRNSLETHTCVCTKTHTYTEGHPFTMYRTEWFQSLDAITQLVQFTCNKQQSTASFTPSTV